MWEINNSLQLLSFARAIGLGVVFCLAYDVLRALRKANNFETVTIFFQDAIFSVLAAFTVFAFLLSVTNGELRSFVLVGAALGFAVSRFTVSVVFLKVLTFTFSKILWLFSLCSASLYSCFDFFEKNIKKICEKCRKTLKKLLKILKGLLYTKGRTEDV